MAVDQYEKSIREKVFKANILSNGEWVYLVGLFALANDQEDLIKQNDDLKRQLGNAMAAGD